MKIRQVAFDLDDTLIANSHKYNRAIWRCGQIITEALGPRCPYASELMKLHYELDTEMVKTWKFRADRFPTSWVRLYESLCARLGTGADPGVSGRLYETAGEFRRGPFPPYEGVPEMLDRLRLQGRGLYLVTAGDAELQREKIADSGLTPRFDEIRVIEMDKEKTLAELFGSDPGAAAMIGDSLRSDIAPAVKLGMTGIHVASLTWPLVNAALDPSSYHSLASVLDVPDLLFRLEQDR